MFDRLRGSTKTADARSFSMRCIPRCGTRAECQRLETVLIRFSLYFLTAAIWPRSHRLSDETALVSCWCRSHFNGLLPSAGNCRFSEHGPSVWRNSCSLYGLSQRHFSPTSRYHNKVASFFGVTTSSTPFSTCWSARISSCQVIFDIHQNTIRWHRFQLAHQPSCIHGICDGVCGSGCGSCILLPHPWWHCILPGIVPDVCSSCWVICRRQTGRQYMGRRHECNVIAFSCKKTTTENLLHQDWLWRANHCIKTVIMVMALTLTWTSGLLVAFKDGFWGDGYVLCSPTNLPLLQEYHFSSCSISN